MSLGDLEMISVSGGYCILDERMLVVGFGETKQDASLSLFCNIVDYKDKHGLDIEEISVFILDRSDPEGEQND